jgi:hypothetical protein
MNSDFQRQRAAERTCAVRCCRGLSSAPVSKIVSSDVRRHRERGSLGAGRSPASLEANNRAPSVWAEMNALRVLVLEPRVSQSRGPGGHAEGSSADPSPSSPALVNSSRCPVTISLGTNSVRRSDCGGPRDLARGGRRLGPRLTVTCR